MSIALLLADLNPVALPVNPVIRTDLALLFRVQDRPLSTKIQEPCYLPVLTGLTGFLITDNR
jgi:hypothetical protein